MMKTRALLALPLFIAGCANTAGVDGPPLAQRDQIALDKALAGKVAGEPRDCLSAIDLRDSRSFGSTTLYRVGRNLTWRTDFQGCGDLGFNSVPVYQIRGGNLCRGEIVRVIDRSGGFERGSCTVGSFVPYRPAR